MVAVGKEEKKNMRAILNTMEIIKYSKNLLGEKKTHLSPSLMIMETIYIRAFPAPFIGYDFYG